MNAILISTGIGIATQIITNIGFVTLLSTATSVTNTSQNVYKILKNMSDSDDELSKEIMQLDFEATIKILNELINKLVIDETNTALVEGIQSLRDIIFKIETELNKARRITSYNNDLWFLKKFRKYDCAGSISRLRTYKKILNNRMKLLREIMEIKYHFPINK